MTEPVERHFLGLSPAGFHRNVYWDWAPTGPDVGTLVTMHGLTRNGRDFDRLAAQLTANFRVVCPDVVGRGHSDRLPAANLYGYPQYLADMAALLARLDTGRVDWLGTSMGGLMGMILAAQPKTPIRRLILNDVGPFIPKAALERIGSYVGQDPHFDSVADVEAYLRRVHAPFGPLSDADWSHLARYSARALPGGGLALAYDPAIGAAFQPVVADVDLWPLWDKVACPVLIIRGGRSDLLLRDTADEMVRRKPGTALVEFPECGHAPALMDESQIAVISDWLRVT